MSRQQQDYLDWLLETGQQDKYEAKLASIRNGRSRGERAREERAAEREREAAYDLLDASFDLE